MKETRRSFIKNISQKGITLAVTPQLFLKDSDIENRIEGKNLTFLFQGDSITDGNRTRNNDWNHILGHGFMYLIASRLWFEKPEAGYKFLNRGISGHKITDLEKRWETDTLALKPDVLSILVGINDAHSMVRNQNPESVETFEETYRRVLTDTKKALPNVVLILCEPFVLPVGMVNQNAELWFSEVKKRQAVVRKLASEFGAIHIPFQEHFNKVVKKVSAEFWCWDGIHPMPVGHELMARTWIKEVGKKIKF